MLPEFGNDSYEAADNFMTGRANGLLTYHNRSPAAWLTARISACNIREESGTTLNGRRISRRKTAMATPFPPPTAPAWGSTLAPPTPTLRARWRNSASAWLTAIAPGPDLGLKYDQDNLYGGKLRAYREHDLRRRRSLRRLRPRADAIEAVAQYHFDSGVTPSLAYLQTRGRNLPGIGDADLVKYRIWR